ncbi:MAG: Methylated-DNA/protein-cysteine methyltransferase [Parcubacteria group bacterium GW2011_GWC1_45_9]|nr:MAG: Methylated-DNA/protein-cysteine methyltransferase [Parcubacteria group bacterium GW2011_GWB1_45_10]KKU17370.1 MAG: Methylated-DNA/protein-cysteine methyltransferase [Parcubacteria group bacterium GW2011_GWC1_45_9]
MKRETMKQGQGFFEKVFQVVKKIPKGKVMTYGQIAKALGTRDARKVGWALHSNNNLKTPCHRVVNNLGGLAKNFAFDGWKEQKKRLLKEGVKFKTETQVDLEKHLWRSVKLK